MINLTRGRGDTARFPSNSAAPPIRSGVRPTSTWGRGRGSSWSILYRAAVSRRGNNHAHISILPTRVGSRRAIGKGRSGGANNTYNVAGQPRASLRTPEAQAEVEEPVVVAESCSSPSNSPTEEHGTVDDTVKAEEDFLASSVMVDDDSEGKEGAARRVGTRIGGKRKDRGARSSAQSSGTTASSKGSGRYDKRSPRAVDKDAVVLDPKDQGAPAGGGTSDTSIGARVTIKPDPWIATTSCVDTEPARSQYE